MLPTFVIDYPEAHEAMRVLEQRFGVKPAGVLPSLGARPVSADMVPHSLPAEPFIAVNGSGNYHHESVPLVEGFLAARLAARPGQRFAYVQIDAHPDKDDRFRWKCDCASFVGRVMKSRALEGVWLLGIYPPCLEETNRPGHMFTPRLGYYGEHYFRRMHTYVVGGDDVTELFWQFQPEDLEEARANPSVAEVLEREEPPPPLRKSTPAFLRDDTPQPCLDVRWQTLEHFEPARDLPDLPLYVTVDLDVCKDKPTTDWRVRGREPPKNEWGVVDNQGTMAWQDLLSLIERIGAARQIAAADFCGLTKDIGSIPDAARERSLDGVAEIYQALTQAIRNGRG